MTKTDASRLFGQVINHLLLEYYPVEEESPRFHFKKIVTVENNEINWPATAKNIIPRYLTLLPIPMINDLKAIDLFCRESKNTYPLDMKEFTNGLTKDFLDDIYWIKNEFSQKTTIVKRHKDTETAWERIENSPISRRILYLDQENDYYASLHPVIKRQPLPALTLVKKAWMSLISWIIVVL